MSVPFQGISVFRASDDGQPVCYASPLNVSEVMGPGALESYKGQHPVRTLMYSLRGGDGSVHSSLSIL